MTVTWRDAPSLRPVQSRTVARIDRFPSAGTEPDVLSSFLEERARPWGGVPVSLSAAVTCVLWTLLALNIVFGGWLVAVRSGIALCSGFACTVLTLGDHLPLTLVLSGVCAVGLVGSLWMTHGFSRAAGPHLAVLVVAALSGVVALSGAVALLVGAALCLGVAFAVLLFVVDRL
jgi:hypothetical protein